MNNVQNAIGLDVGTRRIGVARGDTEVKLASPLPAIANDDHTMADISQIIRDQSATIVVVGLPRNNNGDLTKQSQYCLDFADRLKKTLPDNIMIVMQDESLTSVAAEVELKQNKHYNDKMLRDGTLDSRAATIILSDYLNSQR